MAAQFSNMAHPVCGTDYTVGVFRNDAQVLALLIVDVAGPPIQDHPRVSADRSEWRAQIMRDVRLHIPSDFD